MTGKGKIFLVGAGPAGRELITLRGLSVLRRADVVIHDYLIDPGLLDEAKPGAEVIDCRRLGKDRSGTSADAQDKINALAIDRAKKGRNVVRLKNGDPLIFGRAAEELAAFRKARVRFEIVPGVSAAQAAAAFSGIPLTGRGSSSSVVFAAGREDAGKKRESIDWKAVAGNGTIVFYMGVADIARVAGRLMDAGKPARTPVAVIERAGRAGQREIITDLGRVAAAVEKKKVTPPAIFLIGETVKQRFLPLDNARRILYTGLSLPEDKGEGIFVHQPLIRIASLDNYGTFDGIIRKIGRFDWLIFTSRYAVRYFFERLFHCGKDARSLRARIAAIGRHTGAALERYGVRADVVPGEESAQGLLRSLGRVRLRGRTLFYPHSDLSDKILVRELRAQGARVTEAAAYRTMVPADLPDLELSLFDEIFFTSPSGVRNFVVRYGRPPKKVKISCIGKITRSQAVRSGLI